MFKTDRRAYALILGPLAAEPSEIAFVSSNRWDVAGAAAFGLVPIWVTEIAQHAAEHLPLQIPALLGAQNQSCHRTPPRRLIRHQNLHVPMAESNAMNFSSR